MQSLSKKSRLLGNFRNGTLGLDELLRVYYSDYFPGTTLNAAWQKSANNTSTVGSNLLTITSTVGDMTSVTINCSSYPTFTATAKLTASNWNSMLIVQGPSNQVGLGRYMYGDLYFQHYNSSGWWISNPVGPLATSDRWVRVNYDGTNLNFFSSADGITWTFRASEAAATYCGTPAKVGLGASGNPPTAYASFDRFILTK